LNSRQLTLAASMLVTFVLGSVHAFSVFIAPLERLLLLPRAEVSLIYSLALVALTLAVLLGYRVYPLLAPARLIILTCLAAAAGLALAARASGWWLLCIGYSLVFGFSNGIGYGYCLQLVGRAMPEFKGFAMGAVTAAYAVGSVVFAQVFAWRIAAAGVESALLSIAAALVVCGVAAALMLRYAGAAWGDAVKAQGGGESGAPISGTTLFWIAYMTAVFAGLMAIGHAAGIALSRNATPQLSTLAAITTGVGSALGGFASGWLIERLAAGRLMIGLPLLSAAALLAMAISREAIAVVALLSLVGFSYGSVIAVYPVAISDRFGARGPQAYGRIFTAWGFAGLAGPWSAGWIFDWRGGYEPAMLAAAVIAVLSALFAARIRSSHAV
jgi:OFA family oxalate/formate antiporter-like MFS transporter